MWIAIFLVMLLLTGAGIRYIVTRIARFQLIQRLAGGKKRSAIVFSSLIAGLFAVLLFLTMGIWNLMVVLLHVLAIWGLCDWIAGFIEKKGRSKKAKIISGLSEETYKTEETHESSRTAGGNREDKKKCAVNTGKGNGNSCAGKAYPAGIAAIIVSVLWLGMGWYFAHHVYQTNYVVETEKELGTESFRIVGFADSHVGTTFHWQGFSEYIEEMNAQNPDIVVIAGDFVDDDTTVEDMVKCCEALGNLKTRYGVYYVFGNHDKGYYRGTHGGFTAAELVENLEKNGVIVLQDQVVPITGNIYVMGRQDREKRDRADMMTMMQQVPEGDYVIVLDHQPGDYQNQAAAGADLVLSGHTHGGQLIPITYMGEWTGLNDKTYGYETRERTGFMVTSGISDWAIKFKTGCISEYFVIDVKQSK